MNAESLKEYIFLQDKIPILLEDIGCGSIKYHSTKEFYSCSNYNGDNIGAINIKNNKYLNCVNYTREKDFDENSDIIDLVCYNKNINFREAVIYIHKLFNLELTYDKKEEKKEKIDPLAIFKRVKSKKSKVNVSDITVLDESVLSDFLPYIHISWFREGVMKPTIEKFGLGYSNKWKRVIIPMRYWLTGELLGYNARTTVENYDEFGISKFYLTPTYPKNYNIFGLWEHYEDIQKLGYCVVYESEKSVLKRDSLLDCSGVAISGHCMSDEQVRILIGLNVDIIISMDNDVSLSEIRHMCSKFYGIRNVYYTYDKYKILGKKDSIADAKNKIFEYLFKYKVKYDYKEHCEYLKSLEK